MNRFYLILTILILSGASLFAQDTSIDSLYRISEYNIPKLPAFTVIFDSVMSRSPQKMRLQKNRIEALYNMGLVKKEWMNFISIGSGFSYGKGVGLGSSLSGNSVVNSLSNTTTSTYSGGLSLGFTLGAILNYKTKVKIARVKVDQSQYEIDLFERDFRIKLFEQYTQLENDLNAFKAANLTMEMNNAQIIFSEKQFRLGRMNLQQLIAARQNYNSAVSSFDAIKRSCKIGIYFFEQISGIDFKNVTNQIQGEQ